MNLALLAWAAGCSPYPSCDEETLVLSFTDEALVSLGLISLEEQDSADTAVDLPGSLPQGRLGGDACEVLCQSLGPDFTRCWTEEPRVEGSTEVACQSVCIPYE